MAGASRVVSAGVELGFLAFYSPTTNKLTGGTPTAPAAGDQNGSPAYHILGVKEAAPASPEPEDVPVTGDNVLIAEFQFPSTATRRFLVDVAVFDHRLINRIQGTNAQTYGSAQMTIRDIPDQVELDTCLIFNAPTKKEDLGVEGRKAWSGTVVPLASAISLGRVGYTERGAAVYRFSITPQLTDQLPWGITIDNSNFDTTGGRYVDFTSDYPLGLQVFTGDNSENTWIVQNRPVDAAHTYANIGGNASGITSVTPGTQEIVTAVVAGTNVPVIILYEFDRIVEEF